MSQFTQGRAVVVGVAEYQHINGLPNTVIADARDIRAVLIDANACGYDPNRVQLLLNDKATKGALRSALEKAAAECDEDSTFAFYVSSHGGRVESGEFEGEYLLPVDTVYDDDASLARSSLSGKELADLLWGIPARRLVAVFDCCHSAGIGVAKNVTGSEFKRGLPESFYKQLATGQGKVIFASCRDSEFSYVHPKDANSVFTKHLLDGLRGGVPGAGGVIRVFDLFHYLQPKVVANEPNQHPVFKCEVEDNFPVALHTGGKGTRPTSDAERPRDTFQYDVFLSYRQQDPDKSWVQKTLLPRLKAEGLKVCIDTESFRLGAHLVSEMERAVEQSRYTLAVLSPAYLDSSFTELENILAEHLGLEERQRRLLAVMREQCKPRLGVRARLWLDMRDDREFDMSVARLVQELRMPPAK
jgi:uncharacterized caspase-like protein